MPYLVEKMLSEAEAGLRVGRAKEDVVWTQGVEMPPPGLDASHGKTQKLLLATPDRGGWAWLGLESN